MRPSALFFCELFIIFLCLSVFTFFDIDGENQMRNLGRYNLAFTINRTKTTGGTIIKQFKNIEFHDGETAFISLYYMAIKNYVGNPEFIIYQEWGAFLNSIFDFSTEGNYWWHFYVNGELSNFGISDYKLVNGDDIFWDFSD